MDLVTLVRQFGQEVVGLGEPGLQVLHPHEQAGELFVAVLGGAGRREGTGDRLAEQRELRGELGPALAVPQGTATAVQRGAGAVDTTEDLGDPLQDGRADGGVTDVQTGDDVGHRAQVAGVLVEPGRDGLRLGHGGDRLGVGDELLDAGAVVGEGVLVRQAGHGPLPERGEVSLDVRGEFVDAVGVGVPHVLEGEQVSLRLPEFGEPRDPRLGAARGLAAQAPYDGGDAYRCLGERVGCLPGERLNRLELGQHLFGGGPHLCERFVQGTEVRLGQPVVGVRDPCAGRQERLVHLAGRGGLGDRAGDGQAVGDAAHEVGVADAGERAGAGRLSGGVGVGDVRRGPPLHGVHALRLGVGRSQDQEGAVVEQGPAVAGQRGGDLLADDVVGQEETAARDAGVEGEEDVLAVRGADRPLELQTLGVDAVERPVGTGGQAVAAGEDDALVLGQPAA